jgi:hypothetical protein
MALRVAGLSVTFHPSGKSDEAYDDEVFEVAAPPTTTMAQHDFETKIRVALAGTGFRPQGGILPGS